MSSSVAPPARGAASQVTLSSQVAHEHLVQLLDVFAQGEDKLVIVVGWGGVGWAEGGLRGLLPGLCQRGGLMGREAANLPQATTAVLRPAPPTANCPTPTHPCPHPAPTPAPTP
jgi:hypothetical protein